MISRFQSPHRRLVAGCVGAALVASAGLAASTASAQPLPVDRAVVVAPHISSTYSAKTIYRGVFFGHGPVAAVIPRYVQNPAPETAATRATEDKIMALVEKRSPGAVQGFADTVASGSHVATRAALLRNSAILQGVIADVYGVEATEVKQNGFVAIAVVAAVVAVVWKYVKVYSVAPSGAASNLEMDGLVHALITKI